MTIQEAQQQLQFQLYHLYDNREAANIADWVMEAVTEWKKIDRIVNKQLPLLDAQVAQLEHITEQLMAHRPVQYVLGETWFYGYKFYVNEHVLIPRPETEELAEWVITDLFNLPAKHNLCTILDIGTGSGCLSVTLQKQFPQHTVYGIDISAEALSVAAKNAAFMEAPVRFQQLNFLDAKARGDLPVFDIIVSNPPYIPVADKATMQPNVLAYEPHLALFVPNNEALIFYEAIAAFGQQHLSAEGLIYVETHEALAAATARVFSDGGYREVIIKNDLQGKQRMVKAVK